MGADALTLAGIDMPQGRDPLGIWSVVPQERVSFAVPETAEAPLIWQIQLPASYGEADQFLGSRLSAVSEDQAALTYLESAFFEMAPSTTWSLSDRTAESELWRSVAAVRSLSYGAPAAQAWGMAPGDLIEQGRSLFLQLRRLFTHFAWIETAQAGEKIGITKVNWRGDFETTWGAGGSSEEMALHVKSVRLTMQSRLTLLRVLTVVVGGALALAARASVPGGQVLLIPAVYRYVREVLTELERIRVRGHSEG